MNLALSSTEFGPGELEPFLEYCLRMEVRAVELWCGDHVSLKTLREVRRRLKRDDIRVACVSTWTQMNKPGAAEQFVPLIIESLRIAHELGAPLANTYFGPNPSRKPGEAVDAYERNIDPCLREAERLGVTLTIENEFDASGEDPTHSDITRRADFVAGLIRRVDSPHLRANFDATNFLFAGEEPYPRAYEVLRGLIGYVHLKDGTRYDEQRHGAREKLKIWRDGAMEHHAPGEGLREFVCVAVGDGAVNHDGLLHALERDGYSGWFALEPHVAREDLDDVCRRSIDYLKRIWKGAP